MKAFAESHRWGWFRLDREVVDRIAKECGTREMLLYILIACDARFADGPVELKGGNLEMRVGEAILAQENMAERLGCKRKPVRTSLERLYKHGSLVRVDARTRYEGPFKGKLPTMVQLPFYLGFDSPLPSPTRAM